MRILLGRADRGAGHFMARALREEAYAVDVAASSQAVLAECDGVEYAAILLHWDLGQRSGRGGDADPADPIPSGELGRRLRARNIHAPILLLQPAAELRKPGEMAVTGGHPNAPVPGGSGMAVLQEPFDLQQLRAQVRRMVRQSTAPAAPEAGYWTGLSLDPRMRCARRGEVEVPLTRKEYALLDLLLLRAPRAVSHADIVAQVWDGACDSDSNLIEVYVARLRRRLDRVMGVKLLHTVRGIGYRVGNLEP